MKFNKFIRETIIEQLQRGGNIRVFANGRYQDIASVELDGCGGIVLKLDGVKPEQTFEEVLVEHRQMCRKHGLKDDYGRPATKA